VYAIKNIDQRLLPLKKWDLTIVPLNIISKTTQCRLQFRQEGHFLEKTHIGHIFRRNSKEVGRTPC